MVPQVSTPKVIHHQVQVLLVLKRPIHVDQKTVVQNAQNLQLVHHRVDTLLSNHPKMKNGILLLIDLLHSQLSIAIVLLLPLLDFPHLPETTEPDLIDELVLIPYFREIDSRRVPTFTFVMTRRKSLAFWGHLATHERRPTPDVLCRFVISMRISPRVEFSLIFYGCGTAQWATGFHLILCFELVFCYRISL